jgi:hypothetical protein
VTVSDVPANGRTTWAFSRMPQMMQTRQQRHGQRQGREQRTDTVQKAKAPHFALRAATVVAVLMQALSTPTQTATPTCPRNSLRCPSPSWAEESARGGGGARGPHASSGALVLVVGGSPLGHTCSNAVGNAVL